MFVRRYLVREWGAAIAREAMLTTRPIKAEELLAVRGVHYVGDTPEQTNEKCDEIVGRLKGSAPRAMATIKRLVKTAISEVDESQKAVVKDAFLDMMRPNPEAKYGIEMFRKKEKPDWSAFSAVSKD
jgi:enoyl-CoA hydratase/carnithine racemase